LEDKVEKGEDKKGGREEEEKGAEVEEEVPVLINRDLPTLQSVLEKADVVLEVIDARDPLAFRSEHVEQSVKDAGKKLLFVLNKIVE
jgi:nuclear GTP-binding protein